MTLVCLSIVHLISPCKCSVIVTGDPDGRRSVSGFCILFGGSLHVGSPKSNLLCLSSAVAEYRSLSKAVVEITWLSRLYSEFGIPVFHNIPIYCDNQASIYIAKNPIFHERIKFIELDRHFV